ncbi:probable WRKY transcription factor 50 isoform X2 [Olea europaea var. sylvestris]|uniref:probable WRKY transcription factor 50 isoform X2 n=1 Tax=Olea europaea var. sylvestris TaxID=158386 RepID=UPI000C1D77FE|nr:probable WRKY transcription factor 50 isoform X2 [Olea europaea var. sylvestris]
MAHYYPSFEFSDVFEFNDWLNEEDQVFGCPQNLNYAADEISNSSGITSSSHREGPGSRDGGNGREKKQNTEKVAFKTKSEVEVLDDGFKWRKYGKKMVKNSPNPRNYYKCSVEGCPVKKRVERDTEDPRYVLTTYHGIHNHRDLLSYDFETNLRN